MTFICKSATISLQQLISKYVKEKKSCLNYNLVKSPGEKKRGDVNNMFTVHIASYLKRNGLFVYDVTQSLTAPSEYNLLVKKEIK